MKRKLFLAIAVALGALIFAGQGWTQTQESAPYRMPRNNTMQMRGHMMGKQNPQAKPGQMQGKKMHMGNKMSMGDPLFAQLHGYGCPGFVLKFADQLNLTKEQIQKLEALKLDFKKTAIQNRADRQVTLLDLKEILNSSSPNFKRATVKINQITQLDNQLRAAFLNAIKEGRQVLTSEQWSKLKSLSNKPDSMMMGSGMMH